MLPSRWSRLLVALLSAGWLVPLCIGIDWFCAFVRDDLPRLSRGLPAWNSAPLPGMALIALEIAAAWLALVIVFWAQLALRPLECERASRSTGR